MSFLDAWDYELPDDLIARYPTSRRDHSRLMELPINGGPLVDRRFDALASRLAPGDLLVVNNTKVLPSRVFCRRPTGGKAELLVLDAESSPARALARPAKKLVPGTILELDGGGQARVVGRGHAPGEVLVEFGRPTQDVLNEIGEMPLPPYLRRDSEQADRDRYQTIYAAHAGSAAAPTAGLHFTPEVFAALKERGVGVAEVTLHVGLGTFRPLTDEDVERGSLHHEVYDVPESTSLAVRDTRRSGGRVVAVGTTTARTLESATPDGAECPAPGAGTTTLFIRPPYAFKAVDGMITNFHLPRSSLLMLVASLCGHSRLRDAYAHAIKQGYRFYSYGDAMLLL
ncbi:MAG: tRNA preQ1(34) S-adenosylmethionine ribosyltransferase-isomerase QueA [Myxococcota bacterium]